MKKYHLIPLLASCVLASWAHADTLPANVLKALPAADRQNLVVINGLPGSLKSRGGTFGLALKQPIQIDSNTYRDSDGHLFAAPNVTPQPVPRAVGTAQSAYGVAISKDTKTGPYRGVYSKPGYSYEEAIVHLPSATMYPPAIFVDTDHSTDTPYIYMGGESVTGGAVDAGLQHSIANDNWSLFIVCEGFGFHYDTGLRFASDQDIKLKFYVPADNYVAVSATGKDIRGTQVDRTLILNVSKFPLGGARIPAGRAGQSTRFTWHANGKGNTLKRLTSIAQSRQSWTTHSYTRGVHWQDVRIGTSDTTNHLWRQSDVGDSMNWPDKQHIVVRQLAPSDETVNIYLDK